jgi:hypothetical protein
MAKCQTCGGSHLSTHEQCPNMEAGSNKFWSSVEGKKFLRESREIGRRAVAAALKGKT